MENSDFVYDKHLTFLLRGVCFLISFISSIASAASLSETDGLRFATFTQEVRCVVCQNQNLADSTAPLAKDLRDKIYMLILEKKSDKEIKDYLVKRYGEFILLRPRFNPVTYFLWLFPFIGVAGILWFLFRPKAQS